MAARLPTLADEVRTLIDATVVAAGGTTERDYTPRQDLEDAATLKVWVVGRQDARVRAGREVWQHDLTIDVCVQVRATTKALADAAAIVADDLAGVIEDAQPASVATKPWQVVVIPYDPGHLDEHGVFTSVISATWRKLRAES